MSRSTPAPAPSTASRIFTVDLIGHLFRAFHALELLCLIPVAFQIAAFGADFMHVAFAVDAIVTLALLAAAHGVVKRAAWARRAFIAGRALRAGGIVVGVLWILGSTIYAGFFSLHSLVTLALAIAVAALVFAADVWLIRRFRSPEVVAEFAAAPRAPQAPAPAMGEAERAHAERSVRAVARSAAILWGVATLAATVSAAVLMAAEGADALTLQSAGVLLPIALAGARLHTALRLLRLDPRAFTGFRRHRLLELLGSLPLGVAGVLLLVPAAARASLPYALGGLGALVAAVVLGLLGLQAQRVLGRPTVKRMLVERASRVVGSGGDAPR